MTSQGTTLRSTGLSMVTAGNSSPAKSATIRRTVCAETGSPEVDSGALQRRRTVPADFGLKVDMRGVEGMQASPGGSVRAVDKAQKALEERPETSPSDLATRSRPTSEPEGTSRATDPAAGVPAVSSVSQVSSRQTTKEVRMSSLESIASNVSTSEAETIPALMSETGDRSGVVKRSNLFQKRGTRRLTVDARRQRLITDKIEDACEENEEEGNENDKTYNLKSHPAQMVQTPGQVVSIWGSTPEQADRYVPFFSQKNINFDGDFSRMKHRVGVMSHRGHKPESPNQDDFFVLVRKEFSFFGVLDGHGADGHEIAHFAQEHLPTLIMERLRQNRDAWEDVVRACVKELVDKARKDLGVKADYSGTTVSLAMLDRAGEAQEGPLRLRCAHLGDSIVVSAKRKAKGEAWQVNTLTDIHRPDRDDEARRIDEAGGKVKLATEANTSARLLTPDWNLAMSRSFGDFHALPFGLSTEPEFAREDKVEPGSQHFVLACSDGVWDVIPPAQAVQFVGKFKPEEAQTAVERLVSKAQLRWQETEDVVDDITAVLIWPSFEADDDD